MYKHKARGKKMERKFLKSWCENATAWIALISAIAGGFGYVLSTHLNRMVKTEQSFAMTSQNDADIKDLKRGYAEIKIILIEHTEQMKSIPKIEKQLERIVDRMEVLAGKDERKRTLANLYYKPTDTEQKNNGMH